MQRLVGTQAPVTFVCPTEITGISARKEEFEKLNSDILGASVDSKHSHQAWIKMPRDRGGLGSIKFPLASDITKRTAAEYGVLIEEEGIALRGLFIIDPQGQIGYSVVHNLNVGRSADETLRVLQALQSGGLCPVDWHPGEANIAA